MSTRTQIIENLDGCFGSLGEVATKLTDDQWSSPSLCPEWNVQGVLAHVIAIEEILSGWWPDALTDAPPFASVPPIHAELSAAPPSTLIDRLHATFDRRHSELDALDDAAFTTPCATPVGPGTYGRFMGIRVFDCWVHERDIRVPLGLPGDDSGPAAEMALDEVRGSLGYIVGKRMGFPDGASIAFELTGPVQRRLFVKVDGRATVVDELANPKVTVTTDSLTFMLLACGRIDPEGAISDGRITWSGDETLGARAARNLRFTM
ncbi:MAG: maleylpyruvate isomerase family mycothiol-dependent enzyme [Acidimicrobiia bacterium]|nr:maleylpyruvate isomerase family mycothiol-dependent enzyme [Acidimicrobiia bacterium]